MTDLLFAAILIFAAVNDLRHQRIPDIIHAGLLILTMLTWLTEAGSGHITEVSFIVESFAGIFVLAGGMMLIDLFRPGAFGGGDIKLLAAAGLYLGWRKMMAAWAVAVIAGGMSCLLLMMMRKIDMKTKIAFGPFLVIGLITGLFWGNKIFEWLFI